MSTAPEASSPAPPPLPAKPATTTPESKDKTFVSSKLDEKSGPSWLILGGVGFIGRNLVKVLVDKKLAGYIRVADKSHWLPSKMSDEHRVNFSEKVVEYRQADLSKDAHIANIFDRQFDYVVNLCGETRFGVPETEYPAKCVVPCTKVVAACTHLQSVKKFVEVSTAQVYDSDKKPSKEGDKVKPWTNLAKARLEAEEIVKKSSLPYVILRPATVYGPADLFGLMPRICCAAVYQKLKEPMKLLWTAELKTNTVHVDDVCSAIVHATLNLPSGSLFNVVDNGNTDQGKINEILGNIFGIETGFAGTILSNLAKLNFASVCNDANETHSPVWMTLLEEHKMINSPLSTYISQELLYNHHLSADGSAITKTGFTYSHPVCDEKEVRAVIAYAEAQGIFPPKLTTTPKS